MKKSAVLLFALIAVVSVVLVVMAQDSLPIGGVNAVQETVGSAFSYQGLLTEGNTPATGLYDFRFLLA